MKKMWIFIIICHLILLSGCKGRIELDELRMATMIGIDWDSEHQEYQVTLNVIRYTRAKQKNLIARDNSWIVSAKGNTIRDALGNVDSRSSRRYSGVALSVVLIGKQAGEHGTEEILDFLTRSREYRDTIDILSTDTTAYEIMKLLPEHESDIQKEIEGDIEHADWLRAFTPELRQVYVDYNENNGDFVTGAVFRMNPKPFEEVPRKESENVENPYFIAYVSGSAVYKKGKLVGFMDGIETRSFLLVTRKDKNISQKPETISNIKNEKENIDATLDIKSLNSKTDIDLNNKITVNITVDLQANLVEFTIPTNVDTKVIDILRDSLNKKIKVQIESMLSKTQEIYNSDITGVSDDLHKRYPEYWKKNKVKWDEVYPDVKFNVTVNSKITDTGLISNSIKEH